MRPAFCANAKCAAGPDSRFGLLFEDLPRCREYLAARGVRVVGFHVFSGSQVLDAGAIRHHLRGAVDLSLRAADALGLVPEVIDLGGGFGIPYGPDDQELDLAFIARELRSLAAPVAPAQLVVQPAAGAYPVADEARRARAAVVFEGARLDLLGARQPLRAVLEGQARLVHTGSAAE